MRNLTKNADGCTGCNETGIETEGPLGARVEDALGMNLIDPGGVGCAHEL